MNGDRDSQIDVVIHDNARVKTLINGKEVEVGKKISELRKKLFNEHFELRDQK